jgi:hypothetical protein
MHSNPRLIAFGSEMNRVHGGTEMKNSQPEMKLKSRHPSPLTSPSVGLGMGVVEKFLFGL